MTNTKAKGEKTIKKPIYCSDCGVKLIKNKIWMLCLNDSIYEYKDGKVRCYPCRLRHLIRLRGKNEPY